MEEATKKAVILMRAAVAKVNLNAPLQPGESRVTTVSYTHLNISQICTLKTAYRK